MLSPSSLFLCTLFYNIIFKYNIIVIIILILNNIIFLI